MPPGSEGLMIARARIAKEHEKRTGILDLGELGLKEWPNELWDLHHLTCLNLGVGWTNENIGFHFASPGIPSAPNTLPPAAARASWARLPNLRILSLAGPRGDGSPWNDLTGLENLTQLRALDLSWTAIEDLTPLAHLTHLQTLDASYTFASSIAPLTRLTALRHLDLSHTQVADLSRLQAHPALQTLLCYHTPITTVAPLSHLPALQKLDLTQTQVTDLTPLSHLPSLHTLQASWTPIANLPASLVRLPTLQTLILHETAISNVPTNLLSPDNTTNCLNQIHTHFSP